MTQPIIEVKNLGKIYHLGERAPYYALRDTLAGLLRPKIAQKRFWALKGITFDVVPGEVVGIIGRNGAGKSTLLKILSQITQPSQGQVRLRSRVASLLEVGTGFHPELTGRENIFLNGSILGMTRKEIKRKFNEIVAFSEIEKFLDTPVKRYSSGMYVRLAFSVAAHLEPEILLVDEVLAVGDIQFQKKCLDKMEEITRESGRTILFVSHNMGAIENLCHRCMLLDNGRIKMIGPTEKVVSAYLKESHATSLKGRLDRTGNGTIRMTEITFLNKKNEPADSFKYGEPMTIRVRYTSSRSHLEGVTFGLGFDSNIGHRIADVSTLTKVDFSGQVPGRGFFTCKIPVAFNAGRYYITVMARQHGDIADWVRQAAFFDVQNLSLIREKNNLSMPWSSVLPDHQWEIKSE